MAPKASPTAVTWYMGSLYDREEPPKKGACGLKCGVMGTLLYVSPLTPPATPAQRARFPQTAEQPAESLRAWQAPADDSTADSSGGVSRVAGSCTSGTRISITS